jgi:serine/threonine protein phosphatase PrpC
MAIRAGGYTDIGRKSENQDAFNLYRIKTGEVYVGVLDGHGSNGKLIAQRAKELLIHHLKDSKDYAKDKKAALKSACMRTHKSIIEGSVDSTLSGTTATLALVSKSHKLHLAWLGDSRAVMGKRETAGKLTCVALTSDHNCDDPREADRIRRMGGKVEPYLSSGRYVGPNRLWNRGRTQVRST